MKGTMNRSSALKAPAGLQARMLLTIFLLGVVYVVLMAALFASGANGITIALLAGGLFIFQVVAADKIGLRAMGAEEVSPREAPELHAMVERLCVQADLPKPKIAIMRTSMPNAFAMGRSKKAATVAVTTGIMEILSPAELEGVHAHELAHIRHRDVMIMTLVSFFASIASMILQFGFFFGGDDDENPGFLALVLVALAVYVLSFFLMSALSRYREFAADRGAAELTRRPSALSSALMKINGTMQRIPEQDLRAHSELAAFYIARPSTKSLFALFSTHPPMEKRIAALDALERQIQGTTGAEQLAA